jgi:histone H3/H4
MVLAWVLANMILAARMNAVHAGRQTIIVKDIALICKVTKTIEGYTTSLKK